MVHDGVSAKGTTLTEHHTVPEKQSTQRTIYVSEILEGSLLPEVDGNAQKSMGVSTGGGGGAPAIFSTFNINGRCMERIDLKWPSSPPIVAPWRRSCRKDCVIKGKNVD